MTVRVVAMTALAASVALGAAAFRPAVAGRGGARIDAVPGRASARATIEGTVRLTVTDGAEPAMLSPYARRRYRPPSPAAPAPGSPTSVVVYVIMDGAAPGPPAPVTIEQRDRAIVPHVTAVQRGARIHFPNRDDVFHNLFSLSDAHPFNLGRYPPGETRSEVFPSAGVVRIFCDIHSEMGGTILILDTWLMARPGASGRYAIESVPAGRHRVVAWHESAAPDTISVIVPSSGTTTVDFALGQ